MFRRAVIVSDFTVRIGRSRSRYQEPTTRIETPKNQVAGVAQLVEHRFCKPRVVSSSLTASSASKAVPTGISMPLERLEIVEWYWPRIDTETIEIAGGYPSGQRGQTVNLVAMPSQVRILLHPSPTRQAWAGLGLTLMPARPSKRRTPSSSRPRKSMDCRERIETNRGCNSMVEYLPSKQATWVRFPSPALLRRGGLGGDGDACHRESAASLLRV
jgi:hypothetical protein